MKLKEIIESEGITQAELVRESRVSKTTINDVCNGKSLPSLTIQNKIIKALNRMAEQKYTRKSVFES